MSKQILDMYEETLEKSTSIHTELCERVRYLFEYRDGLLIWKVKRGDKIKPGRVAGCVNYWSYRVIRFDYKLYRAHRLIFLYHHGYLPQYVDHIDQDKLNDKIENLRPATKTQNAYNTKMLVTNKSGYKGVTWNNKLRKWYASIKVDGKTKALGVFAKKKDAAAAYNNVARDLHGEFACLNVIND